MYFSLKLYNCLFWKQKKLRIKPPWIDFQRTNQSLWVGDNVLNIIVNGTNAKTLWNKLETLYAFRPCNNKLCMLTKGMQSTYKEGNFILDISSVEWGKWDDEKLALWLLNTLPNSLETL